jgi:formylglycine-generating enzyme required for sulfatase activity
MKGGLTAVVLALAGPVLLAACEKPASGARGLTPPVIRTEGGIEMVQVPEGWFEMGSREGRPEESPLHKIWISSFLMDRCEVTQEQYVKLVGKNPSSFSGNSRCPVDSVSWKDAVLFCNLRSRAERLEPCYQKKEGEWACTFEASGYRLPTEAEWEYACRAGSDGRYAFGSDLRELSDYCWSKENSSKRPHPVGEKKANAWGLCDMHGNVAEWCNDVYSKSYYSQSPEKNPRGPTEGDIKVVRGGGWNYPAENCRSAWRNGENFQVVDTCITDHIGIRCVRKTGSASPSTTNPPSNLERK